MSIRKTAKLSIVKELCCCNKRLCAVLKINLFCENPQKPDAETCGGEARPLAYDRMLVTLSSRDARMPFTLIVSAHNEYKGSNKG